MKKFLISVICAMCVCSAFGAGENVATSKAFVDNAVAQKQDKIPANAGAAQVLTNTGESGNVGTKNIYDSSAAYNGQADSLVNAVNMNTAVQNAINAEFKCIKWVDDDPTKDCLLVKIVGPDMGIQPADGEWINAWLTSSNPASGQYYTWEFYDADASSSIRIPIKPNIEYKDFKAYSIELKQSLVDFYIGK